MDTLDAFARGQAARMAGSPMKFFDWDCAAKLIAERGADSAEAGLVEDWGWTGGPIVVAGQPVPEEDTYVYLCSNWATPVLRFGDEDIECYVMETEDLVDNWEDVGYWPETALTIYSDAKSGGDE